MIRLLVAAAIVGATVLALLFLHVRQHAPQSLIIAPASSATDPPPASAHPDMLFTPCPLAPGNVPRPKRRIA